jgi:hypothetical protein
MTAVIDITSPIEVINGHRSYARLTPEGNRLVGRIDAWLLDHPGFHPPSRVARGVKSATHEAGDVLSWLDRRGVLVVGDGNGCWRKYASRG